MRVLFVISDLGRHGAQNQVTELARELARCGHGVAIYTLNSDAPRAMDLVGSGVEVIVDQKRSKLDPAVLRRLRRKIAQWRPDIVHGFLFDGDIYARIAAVGTGAKVLNSERGSNYPISRLQMAAHWATKAFVDGVVANTRVGGDFACRAYGYKPDQMHVVGNGLRVEELERKAVSSVNYREEFFGEGGFKLLLMIGHIKPSKDYHLAVRTAAALVRGHPEWRVLFVGEALTNPNYKVGSSSDSSAYKRSVLELYEELAIKDKVRFVGMRADVAPILAQADVQLMTSRDEGFPNVVLEGMVLGVPVVSTDYSDIRLILPRPQQVVGSREPSDIVRAILEADRERAAIAAEQREWVRRNATIETATRELERVYERYVSAR